MILTFIDASNDAYGAVSYFRIVFDDENAKVTIIVSKMRVSPFTPTSTPRLELLAAVLGLHLTVSITRSLGMSLSEVRFWSDGMNVLYLIRGKERQFRSLVANRIREIQSQRDPEQWQYILTRENPADLCSQGASGQEIKESELWWQGPTLLKLNEQEWPRKQSKMAMKLPPKGRQLASHSKQQGFPMFVQLERHGNLTLRTGLIGNCRLMY